MHLSDRSSESSYPSWKRIEGSTGGVYSVLSYGLTDSSMDDNHAALVKEPTGYTLILDFDALRAAIENYDQYGDLISNNTQFFGIFYMMDPRLDHKGKIDHVWLRIAIGKGIGSIRVKIDHLGARLNADHLVKALLGPAKINISKYFTEEQNYRKLPVFWNTEEHALVICFED